MDITKKITKTTSKKTVKVMPVMIKENYQLLPKITLAKDQSLVQSPPHEKMKLERLSEKIYIDVQKTTKVHNIQ